MVQQGYITDPALTAPQTSGGASWFSQIGSLITPAAGIITALKGGAKPVTTTPAGGAATPASNPNMIYWVIGIASGLLLIVALILRGRGK